MGMDVQPAFERSPSSFDPAAAWALADGDRQLLAELAAALHDEAPRRLVDLRARLAAGDAEGVARAAHRLRGALSCFGTGPASAAAGAVETAARRLSLAGVARALLDLEREVETLQTELAWLLEEEP